MGNIAWLASYPKSGNTWLRAFIYNLFMQPQKPGSLSELHHTFGRVASPLGLGDDRERIERAVRFSGFRELREQEKRTGFAERSPHSRSFFRAGRKDQWREGLTPAQSRLICSQHREMMQRFA